MKFWKQLVWGVGDFRFDMIRPIKTNLELLETACNRFVRFIVGTQIKAEETPDSFNVRRNHEVRAAKVAVDLDIRRRICFRLCSWVEHLHRHTSQFASDVLHCQGTDWLRQLRADLAPPKSGHAQSGRTQTRAGAGEPFRWNFGWMEEIESVDDGWPNPDKLKGRTSAKADALFDLIFCS